MNQMSAVFAQIFQEFKQQLELEALMIDDSLYQKSKVLTYMKMAKSSFRAFFSLSMTLLLETGITSQFVGTTTDQA